VHAGHQPAAVAVGGDVRAAEPATGRDPQNRRVHVVELTADGEAAFHRMRSAAVEFDRRLRGDLPDEELERFATVLDRLRANVTGG
jgi:MarR family transcriptional regulator, transcriptional regulator for hemolysin